MVVNGRCKGRANHILSVNQRHSSPYFPMTRHK